MSTRQELDKPHKTRIENCKGTLLEPRGNYGKWAYWVPSISKNGWYSTPEGPWKGVQGHAQPAGGSER